MIFKTITISFLFASLVHAQSDPASQWSVKILVEHHIKQHPATGVEDVYKMLHQANFGIGHFLGDTADVRSFLMQELESLRSASENEPLVEQISTDGNIVRANLRPFKKSGLDPELLVHAMFASAAVMKPDTVTFRRQWNEFAGLVRYGFLKFSLQDVQRISDRIASNMISPIHHSQSYEQANNPAYRVVRRDIFEGMTGNAKQP